jgi:hypothetical protein
VSAAIVREIQRHTVERRRSPRTLESLSVTLGWEPQHLNDVLYGAGPSMTGQPITVSAETLWSRLNTLERRMDEMTQLLVDLKTDLSVVIEHVSKDR